MLTAYLSFITFLFLISGTSSFVDLIRGRYPKKRSDNTSRDDAIQLVVCGGIAALGFFLLLQQWNA